MPLPVETLRDLHHIHEVLAELKGRLERGPKQVAAREAAVKRLEEAVEESHDKARQTRMKVDQKQLDLKSGENRVADWKAKLNACSSNKEYQALLDQISAAEMADSVLEDEILEGLDQIETADRQAGEADNRFVTGNEELAKLREKVASVAVAIRDDVTRKEQELVEIEKQLPPDFRPDYERLVKARGADALAPVDDGFCSGCGHQITLNMQNYLRLGKTLLLCKSCGRISYLPEQA